VFVPRRRSEFLVAEAAALGGVVGKRGKPSCPWAVVVVDLCCGSGAVGAALAAALDRVELYAVDVDPAAVSCARRNLPDGRVFEGDLYEPLPDSLRGRVDVLVANAPYVPTEAVGLLPPEARTYEPRVALDGGADGLEVVRRVAAGAAGWLTPGGHLWWRRARIRPRRQLRYSRSADSFRESRARRSWTPPSSSGRGPPRSDRRVG
jgi:release factor glutamine methyltransferase